MPILWSVPKNLPKKTFFRMNIFNLSGRKVVIITMDNKYETIDVEKFLKETKGKRFFFRLLAPSGDKVWTTGGWANATVSQQDWEPDAEVFNRVNVSDRYYEVSRDQTRTFPTFADATKLIIVEGKEESV
jgi:hypothetical protein